MGAKSGIVATITAAKVDEISFIPKASPRKYIKGSKKAAKRKSLKSLF